ncbi:hypothetical protein SteCoe_33568 [Stentor coeruleus]|uniref:Uncharacterized protein n=1 Tax=Stentor coeruleus TaxID=5963 RepID=A0A1R2AWH3_9CILI|nr:hypothetical protein SteCoe_33568 [Stentor coeruleus]
MGAFCHKEDNRPAAVITAIQNYDTGFKFCQEDLSKRLTAYNWTYLHLAVWMNKEQIVENLLRLGAEVNIQDANGDTALHLALIIGQKSIAKCLLENGARFDIANVVRNIKEGVKAMELMTGESIELMKFTRTETEVEEIAQLIGTDGKRK